MLEVNRSVLLEDLESAAHGGSLLVIGEPGAGKTWLLNQFVLRRKAAGDEAVLIHAEDHAAGSLQELLNSIGVTDLVAALRAFPGKKKYLVIDSLDSLRAEASQRAFRDLMRLVQRELPDWAIIASMRTFDARESVEFRNIFPNKPPAIKDSLLLPTRNLVVPVFSEGEMAQAVVQDPRLNEVLANASLETRRLLQNPYNVWLVIHLLDESVAVDWLSSVQSTVQLLERYWQHRIDARKDADTRKHLLFRLTREMVTRNTLVLSRQDVSNALAEYPSALLALLSDEILQKSTTDRISFTHNILFDFAVARLLLDETTLVPFLHEEPAHSIFFRPSIGYFLTRLWFSDRDLFWDSAQRIFAKDSAVPARARVTPALVVVECAEAPKDLTPLKSMQQPIEAEAVVFLLRAIQATEGMASRKGLLWLFLLGELSDRINRTFLNEYVALIEAAIEAIPEFHKITLLIAVRFLRWLWEQAASEEADDIAYSLASVAAGRVIPMVATLYGVSPTEARSVLEQVLDRIGNPRAAANEAYWLANRMDAIIETEPVFATEIYARIYGYRESSQKKTHLGGPVFSMTSTRAQDFSMAYYILGVKFPLLIGRDWIEAARAAVRAANGEIQSKEGDTIAKLGLYKLQIRIAGVESELRSDRSEIWDEGYRESTSLGLLDQLLRFAAEEIAVERISGNDVLALIKAIAECNLYAAIWKRVLEFAVHQVSLLKHLSELLIIPELLASPETIVAAGKVLTVVFEQKLYTEERRRAIEEAVLQTPNSKVASAYKDANKMRDRLLGCIPESALGPESREIVKGLKNTTGVPQNEPFFRIGPVSYGSPDEDWWLRDQGVETKREENQRLLEVERALKDFSSKFLNSIPSKEEAESVGETLRNAASFLRSQKGADQAVVTQVFSTIAAAAESILKIEQLPIDSPLVQLCLSIVLEASQYPHPEASQDADANFDRPMWGSFPAVEGAQGIMHFVWNHGLDLPMREAISRLVDDARPAVRYQVAASMLGIYKWDRELFWDVVNRIRERERSTGVFVAVATNVTHSFVVKQERKRVIDWVSAVLKQKLPKQRTEDILEVIAYSLTHLAIYYGDIDADRLLAGFARNPKRYSAQLQNVVRVASQYLLPDPSSELKPEIARSRALKVIERTLAGCDAILHRMIKEGTEENPRKAERRAETFRELLKTIDNIVFQLYIALGVNKEIARDNKTPPTEAVQVELFMDLRPIWDLLTEVNSDAPRRPLAPPTTHHLMEIFTALLAADPALVLKFAARLLSGHNLGYAFDSMAIQEIVKLTDKILADYKQVLKVPENASNLGSILDVFVSVGWPQATRLVMLLDNAVR